MDKIIVTYSEEFRGKKDSRIAGKIYKIFKKKGFKPDLYLQLYDTQSKTFKTDYVFLNGIALPQKSELENMLTDIQIQSIEIKPVQSTEIKWLWDIKKINLN